MIKLTVKTHGEESEQKTYNYEFDQPLITIGRLKENDIPLPLSTVSGYHAQIVTDSGNHYLQDRSSVNGTFLNGQKLTGGERKLLQDGDTIRIETFDIYFTVGMSMMNSDQGATVQVARQMVMELLGSWESQQEPAVILMGGPSNGKKVPLAEGQTLVIGRSPGCDILIEHPTISRKHAELSFSWNGAFVKDLDAPNGVYVNDLRITGTARLRDRDEIRLGQANTTDAVRLVFSNPAEALLFKIEQAQSTDSNPIEIVQDSEPIEEPAAYAPPPEQPPVTSETPAPPPTTEPSSPPPVQEPPAEPSVAVAKPSKSKAPLVLFVLIALGAGIFALYRLGYLKSSKTAELKIAAKPDRASPGESIAIELSGIDTERIKSITLGVRNVPILERNQSRIRVKIPAFPNEDIGQKKLDLVLERQGEPPLTIPFALLILPEVREIEPSSGKPGTEVTLLVKGNPKDLQIFFGDQQVTVQSYSGEQMIVTAPQPANFRYETGIRLPVIAKAKGLSSTKGPHFELLPGAFLKKLAPGEGTVGTEVNIEIFGAPATTAEVFFGSNKSVVKSTTDQNIIAVVPAPAESIPAEGLNLPVQVKVDGHTLLGDAVFKLSREPEKPVEIFELSFQPAPYPSNLGFNEYSIVTDIGPFIVLVDKDQYGSSRERAEAVAKTLNSAVIFYRQNTSARITTSNDGNGISLFAEGPVPEQRILLLRAHPSDALAYGKINQNVVDLGSLAEWWRMLIDSYLKVFVQFQSPSGTGILSAGGSILQQVSSFYSEKDDQGRQYYKKDFLTAMPANQKSRLASLSLSIPRKIASVDGKWIGTMSNILYDNIPDNQIEIALTIRQKDGSVSGSADINWKIGMGKTEGGFQNVAYKKLGTFSIKGSFEKTKSFPLEFSFREKDSHLLKFVGKLQGESLSGSFVDSNTGKEGVWNARLQ